MVNPVDLCRDSKSVLASIKRSTEPNQIKFIMIYSLVRYVVSNEKLVF